MRGWAVRLLVEEGQASETTAARLAEMARKDDSPAVRLALASGLQRLPPGAALAHRGGAGVATPRTPPTPTCR